MLAGAMVAAMPAAIAQETPANQNQNDNAARYEAAMNKAKGFEQAGQWRQAADAYAEAMQLRPDSRDARDGFNKAQSMMNNGSTIQSVDQMRQVQQERAKREFADSMSRSQQLLKEFNFKEADVVAITAEVQLDQAKQYLGDADYSSMKKQVRQLRDDIEAKSHCLRTGQGNTDHRRGQQGQSGRNAQAADGAPAADQ